MNFENKKAIYLQIADFICEQILLEIWPEKFKIPSIRELAVKIEVNPNTVIRAYAYLEEQKIIEMRRGIGYFVTDTAFDRVVATKKEEFLSYDLPNFSKKMNLLQIDLPEIMTILSREVKHEKEQ